MNCDDNGFKEKDITATHISNRNMYCIMRVGKTCKDISGMAAYKKYVEREIDTPNVDKNLTPKNEILIGSKDIVNEAKSFLKDTFVRKNSVIGREVMLTSSPGFFKNISKSDLELWKQANVEWLKMVFGDNCIFAVFHQDETSYHIHAFIIPRIFNNTYGRWTLQNYQYFGGRSKLRMLQDSYHQHISRTFPQLQRGIKYSKAKNIDLKTFYKKVNERLDEHDIEGIMAKAKQAELLEIELEAARKTIQLYAKKLDKDELDIKELNAEIEVYRKIIEKFSIIINMSEESVQSLKDNAVEELNSKKKTN